jgi:serine protease
MSLHSSRRCSSTAARPYPFLVASCLTFAAAAALLLMGGMARAQVALDSAPLRINHSDELPGTDRVIVKYRDGVDLKDRSRAASAKTSASVSAAQVAANRLGVRFDVLRKTADGSHVLQINRRLNAAEAEAFAHSLRSGDANVEYAEPDKRVVPMWMPNDAMFTQQWSLSDATGGIRAPAAWDRASGASITVAVIDTGVRSHVDLADNLLPGYDFIVDTKMSADGDGRDADALDPGDGVIAGQCAPNSAASNSSWHGTHVAGLIAAVANNGGGVAGVAFGAKVLPLRAVGRCGGYSSDVADAITWAAGASVAGLPVNRNPARVINLSLGGGGSCDRTTQTAINTARSLGAVVVVAAGNANANAATTSPANCQGVVTVAATAKSGGKASYSNFGDNVTLAAPGGDRDAGMWSTLNMGTLAPGADAYASYAGTSMATPVVSGVVALMLSANKNLTPDQVAALLKSSARAFPAACGSCGAGLVDANAAVAAALGQTSTPTPAPAPTPTPTATAPGDTEPNDSIASAVKVTTLPATISGTLSSSSDNDYFVVNLNPGKVLTITLTPNAALGTALGMYLSNGQQLGLFSGAVGQAQRVQLSNSGTTAVPVAVRVLRSGGTAGAYQLVLVQ